MRFSPSLWIVYLAAIAPVASFAQSPAGEHDLAAAEAVLEARCYDCHGYGGEEGGVALDQLVEGWRASPDDPHTRAELRGQWERVMRLVRADVMPPHGYDRPDAGERATLDNWIKHEAFGIDPSRLDPGRVTLRRLNRNEYRNTVRDLMGVDYDTRGSFPADDSGHGFDNMADVLSVSPLLFEKYVEAAQEIVAEALPGAPSQPAVRVLHGGQFLSEGEDAAKARKGPRRLSFYEPASVAYDYTPEIEGRYELVLNFRGEETWVDGLSDLNQCIFRVYVDGEETHNEVYSSEAGRRHELRFEYDWATWAHRIQIEVEPTTPDAEQVRSLRINLQKATVRGPLEEEHWARPPGYHKWFPRDPPEDAEGRDAYARQLLGAFAKRAFRRPVDKATVDRLASLVASAERDGKTFERGVGEAMIAVLASPRFLFRVESAASVSEGAAEAPLIDEHALASRLSYFLWSTMPDEELTRLADEGQLRKNLAAQFDRLLDDPRSQQFISNFVGQWLRAREIDTTNVNAFAVMSRDAGPDPEKARLRRRFRELRRIDADQLTDAQRRELADVRRDYFRSREKYKDYDLNGGLRRAMRRETEMHFEHVLRGGRSALELLDSDYTFLNQRLAEHYGVEGVEGNQMRRVELPEGSPRGGVLTQGTVLAITSNPDRTSPVKRGLYVLENLLGSPPPPPPPDIPPLEAAEGKDGETPITLRRSLEIHRDSPLCASCHARMDPLGLALENFNALGLERESDRGEPIDTTGTLVSGESFESVTQLKEILASDRRFDFYRCLTEKVFTYALGRGVEYYDTETVDRLVAGLEESGGDLRNMMRSLIDSAPFQRRRAEGAAAEPIALREPTDQREIELQIAK
ncbi:hypothetical protein Mal64_27390 [Pseudobythopirellula maris]|uniref:Planctomycete cytochrome C n=1 Tax=Pseudobythopirellula maris TaxID=2527991 RepID=A0A5C5ZK92_9BACT|nr:DUF1592 domain-containing protein [Pseudobythopirellula maris]TWT87201.1 hypothetical protein Mal64_27390 [Pseudobythopirellula maris]